MQAFVEGIGFGAGAEVARVAVHSALSAVTGAFSGGAPPASAGAPPPAAERPTRDHDEYGAGTHGDDGGGAGPAGADDEEW